MGAKIPDESPTLPIALAYIWELHKSIRFSVIPDDDGLSLMPRSALTIRDVSEYLLCSGISLDRQEFDAILAIDSIYEKYRG